MKEIKRKNRLFADGFIFAKRYLKIPTNSAPNGVLLHGSNHSQDVLDSFRSESRNLKGCWNSKRLFLGSKQSQELLFSTSSTISGIEDDYLNFIEHLPCDIELISLKKT